MNPDQIALLTLHGKAQALEPLARDLGLALVVDEGYDTDQLGTFTGETARAGTQVEAAARKARLACERNGTRYGLGSEGSFGPDPYLGSVPWGIEVVVWYDAVLDVQVHAAHQGPEVCWRQQTVATVSEGLAFAQSVGFPAQGVVVGKPGDALFDKNLRDTDGLRHALEQALAQGPAWVETDLRAHRNPLRMQAIARAGVALGQRLAQRCPGCGARGFGPVRLLPGARCDCCGHATSNAHAQLLECPGCGHTEVQKLRETVPASRCERCNP